MAWTVIIGEDTDADVHTLNTNITPDIHTQVHSTPGGAVEAVEAFITVRGVVTSAVTTSGVTNLTDETLEKFLPRRIRIQESGTSIWDFEPGSCIGGPLVTSFKTESSPGQGESEWRYTLEIYAKVQGNQFKGAYKLETSIEWARNVKGEVIEKTWRAYAEARTAEIALSIVKTFNPGGNVSVRYIKMQQKAAAEALYTWSAEQKDETTGKIKEIIENEPTITPLGPQYLPDHQVSKDGSVKAPILHKAVGVLYEIRISGVVKSLDPDVPVPRPHYNESKTLIRDRGRERPSFPVPDPADPNFEVYQRSFEEVWLWLTNNPTNPPKPNHRDHLKKTFKKPPPDGAAAGTR